MKTLHLAIIMILSGCLLTSINPVLGESLSGEVLFMKSNSIAQIHVYYSAMTLHDEIINVTQLIYTGDLQNAVPVTTPDLTITANPSSVNLNTTTQVTFTITAKDNLKGVYAIARDMGFCGGEPLVIGLNESEIDPSLLARFFTTAYTCPAVYPNSPYVESVYYNGIISKIVTIDVPNSDLTSKTVPEFPFALSVFLISFVSVLIFYRTKSMAFMSNA